MRGFDEIKAYTSFFSLLFHFFFFSNFYFFLTSFDNLAPT